jgi:F-type H+-transporting ATPase subunit delta
LSDAQLERLTKALSSHFGKQLQVNVEIDPEVLGGVHIAINGEVLDATVLTKLQNARLQLG